MQHPGSIFQQRGGTFLGIIIGVLIGLFAALAVAIYITKVPIPFSKNNPTQTGRAEAEAQNNKNWDPNAPLYGRNPGRPNSIAMPDPQSNSSGRIDDESASQPHVSPSTVPVKAKTPDLQKVTPSPQPVTRTTPLPPPQAQASDDPLGDLVKAKEAKTPSIQGDVSSKPEAEPFVYFVQIGAYINPEEAEAQRAKAALAGLTATITEREQAGRQVFRVRLGPYDTKGAAESTKTKLEGNGLEGALVRVQR